MEKQEGKDFTEEDVDLQFGSDSDVEEDRDQYMQYLNPLQLLDSDGKPLPHSFAERLKTEGYIYE